GVPSDLSSIEEAVEHLDVNEINVAISPARTGNTVWETQWLAYFARQVRTFLLSPSLTALSPACAEWTLMRRDDPDAAAASEHRLLNDTYQLVRFEPPQGPVLEGVIAFPKLWVSGAVEVILSWGPDSAPKSIAARSAGSGVAQLVYLDTGVEVGASQPFPTPVGGVDIEVTLDPRGAVAVRLGDRLSWSFTASPTPYGRGLRVASNGAIHPIAPFSGELRLANSRAATCDAR
ncbi:MAG TPA: hypothetical protein VF183_11315, partial [Acidimicrobiales bacterium]